MENLGTFQDFENIQLKTTYSIEIGNRKISPGETVAYFDKIQIMGLDEVKKVVAARGGSNNAPQVFWETTQEQKLAFSQGIFSPEQFALSLNSKLFQIEENHTLELSNREYLESDENGKFELIHTPVKPIFLYEKETGKKLDFTIEEKIVTIDTPFTDIVIDYNHIYTDTAKLVKVGERLISGYLSLEGRTRVKDSKTGRVTTGIIKIPKLKLMSGLSIRLGESAIPFVGDFNGICIPVGERGNRYVSEFYFLDSYLDNGID